MELAKLRPAGQKQILGVELNRRQSHGGGFSGCFARIEKVAGIRESFKRLAVVLSGWSAKSN